MVKPWPIEIDGSPNLKMVDLSMAMLNNQMVYTVVYDQPNRIYNWSGIITYAIIT